MTFLAATIDWFTGKRSAHMGADQYVAHNGMRDGQAMSGALLWAQSEDKTVTATGNMVNAETFLLQTVEEEISDYLPSGITVVELGPGTVTAFKNKTLPIVQKLNSKICILVDESTAFLKKIAAMSGLGNELQIKPIIDDFFENEDAYYDQRGLVCSFGSTISNFAGDISSEPPQDVLIKGLKTMAQAANNGWMLVGFDSDQDGEHIKAFYRGQALFQLNLFYRMAAELPITGDFDPNAFCYEPEWLASSGQLAHIAISTRDMKFKIGGIDIAIVKGQKFHIKNSYKYTAEFFENCCVRAGLSVVKKWEDSSSSKVYLLKIFPTPLSLRPELLATAESGNYAGSINL